MDREHPNVNTLLIRLKANKGLLKTLTWRIIDTWNARGFFHRFLDGDKTHVCQWNVRPCTLRDVLVHFDDWTIDWELGLNEDEIELVLATNWLASLREYHASEILPNDLRYRLS